MIPDKAHDLLNKSSEMCHGGCALVIQERVDDFVSINRFSKHIQSV